MYLIRLVYTSSVSEQFSQGDIENILDVARKNNNKLNVTGMLCFNSRLFLQCLEGSRENVNKVYHTILNDPRHEKIEILEYQEISEREFDTWSMGYVPESSLTKPLNLRFSGSPHFSPYEMSGDSAHRLLLALRDTVPNI
ncbi:BLUF domain-containing protein [Aliikangiella marina]|uniref:BLUF domain-containing protein n=1 Tax=Aliikangiella marina TaxID=1712262 RepID=A0A545TJU7_9GAMM|nr:BLUF domain-containing protein [Aliikangiella marina]TQV77499.1 BLUF domain-containing protein [Aliikangiella marina]